MMQHGNQEPSTQQLLDEMFMEPAKEAAAPPPPPPRRPARRMNRGPQGRPPPRRGPRRPPPPRRRGAPRNGRGAPEPDTRLAADQKQQPKRSEQPTRPFEIDGDTFGAAPVTDMTATRRASAVPRSPLADLETRNEPLDVQPPYPHGDLETQTMDQEEMVQAARSLRETDARNVLDGPSPQAAEAVDVGTSPPPPRHRKPAPAPAPRRSSAGWLVAALLGAVAAALGTSLYKERTQRGGYERLAALTVDVRQSLDSPRALGGDAASIAALTTKLEALRQEGLSERDLIDVRAGIVTLEGLLAVTRGDPKGAESALRHDSLRNAPSHASALRGALATVKGEPEAVEQLTLAIQGGITRPELYGWRAHARLQGGLDNSVAANAVLEDLFVLQAAPNGGLAKEDRVLKIHALLALGRQEEATRVLDTVKEPSRELLWAIALARVEASLQEGEVRAALAGLRDVHGEGDVPSPGTPRAEELASEVLRKAEPHLQALKAGTIETEQRRELLDLLRLADYLRTDPLPDPVIDTLLAAVEAAGQKTTTRLPGEVCLGLAALGPPRIKRRVLVLIFRRLLSSRSANEKVELNLLLCLIVGVKATSRMPDSTELLGGLRDPGTQVELYVARGLAWESFGTRWLRRALDDLNQARRLAPRDPDVVEIRRRILDKVRTNPSGRRG